MTLRERVILAEVENWPKAKQDAFDALVADGQSLSMAHMLASRQAPGLATDDEFCSQAHSLKERVKNPGQRSKLLAEARAQGLNVTENDRYEPGLVRRKNGDRIHRGAWFKHGAGKADLQKRINELGADASHNLPLGVKAARPKETPPPQRVALAPDLVERIRSQRIAEDPSLARVDQQELRQNIIDTHGSKV